MFRHQGTLLGLMNRSVLIRLSIQLDVELSLLQPLLQELVFSLQVQIVAFSFDQRLLLLRILCIVFIVGADLSSQLLELTRHGSILPS